ncbi:hypothetical protein BT69DRAFT_1277988 [Atractiella rhizophila]|nr:hypothetical protein BT69DRAFT_1277988 [Atractiella rhizophila]
MKWKVPSTFDDTGMVPGKGYLVMLIDSTVHKTIYAIGGPLAIMSPNTTRITPSANPKLLSTRSSGQSVKITQATSKGSKEVPISTKAKEGTSPSRSSIPPFSPSTPQTRTILPLTASRSSTVIGVMTTKRTVSPTHSYSAFGDENKGINLHPSRITPLVLFSLVYFR